jgi:hypothetical protein
MVIGTARVAASSKATFRKLVALSERGGGPRPSVLAPDLSADRIQLRAIGDPRRAQLGDLADKALDIKACGGRLRRARRCRVRHLNHPESSGAVTPTD